MIVFGIISGITSIAVIAGCISNRQEKEEIEKEQKKKELTKV